MGKHNSGSSMPNQGDRGSTSGSGGANQTNRGKSGSTKYGAKVHKGTGSQKRGRPSWL